MRFWLILAVLFFMAPVFGFSLFKKKEESPKNPPMVQTVEEWLEAGTNVKMDMRERPTQPSKEEEKFLPTSPKPVYIERYNVKAGSKELDLSKLYKTKNERSPFVANPDFTYATYTETYHYPQTRQTASTFFLIEPDTHLGKKERLLDLSVFEHTRYPLISTALPYLKENFFSTLTLVDFSSDGKKILVKEKRGSHKFGLYETYVWIYFLGENNPDSSLCYRNNVDFSNEISNFDGLDGYREGNQNDFNGKNPFLLYKDSGNYDVIDFKKLKNPPNTNLYSNQKNGEGLSELEKIPAVDWIREGVVGNKPIEKKSSKLTYNDVNDYIKAVWKTKKPGKRFYNSYPVDFRVDIPIEEKTPPGFGVRLNLLNEMIKAYWLDNKGLLLNYIRWDLNPLGFNSNNEDEIIVIAWGYAKNGEKISLGIWGVNINDGLPRFVPPEEEISIQANALFLEEKLNPR